MWEKSFSRKLLDLSIYIKNKVGIQHNISSNNDIGIGFIEAIFGIILPSYGNSTCKIASILASKMSSDQPASRRFQYILQWLSESLSVPLDHISADSLVHGDPLSLYNLLEILDLCLGNNTTSDANFGNLDRIERSVLAFNFILMPLYFKTFHSKSTYLEVAQRLCY